MRLRARLCIINQAAPETRRRIVTHMQEDEGAVGPGG